MPADKLCADADGVDVAEESVLSGGLADDQPDEDGYDDADDTHDSQRDLPACAGVVEGGGNLSADGLANVNANEEDALPDKDILPADKVADQTQA